MSLKIVIPGADFSGLGNPKVESYVAGFPATSLSALYLMEEGTVGQPVTSNPDLSGNGRTAPMVLNSTTVKTALGIGNVADSTGTANRGYAIKTPVAIASKFTVFGVSQDLTSTAASGQLFFLDWLGSGNTTSAASPDVTASNNWGTGPRTTNNMGVLQVNHETNLATAAARANVGLYNNTGETSGVPWVSAQGARPTSLGAVGTINSWVAWALSFDKDVGASFRCMGTTRALNDPADAAAWCNGQIALGGTHLFGISGFNNNQIKGQMGLCGIYDGITKTDTEMDVVIAAAKARMALRGVTAL